LFIRVLTNNLLRGFANKHGAPHNISIECEKSWLKMFLYG